MPLEVPTCLFTGVPGWETEAEQRLLLTYAQGVPDAGVIVEIGAEFGMSASIFCLGARPGVQIFSIDLFPRDVLKVHRDNLREAGLAGRSLQLMGDSRVIGKNWTGWHSSNSSNIDLLFVDGDHSTEGVRQDIAKWTPHVALNGYIVFHDANANRPEAHPDVHKDVDKAIDEWAARESNKWMMVEICDSIRVYKRVAY